MKLALIIDIGTTNIKAGIVDAVGNVLAQYSQKIKLSRPEKGAVEHNPEDLFNTLTELSYKISRNFIEEISVLAFSCYQHGFLPMDSNGNPLTGIITLLDTRSKSVVKRIEREFPVEKIYRKTGSPPMFINMLARLIWFREQKPDLFSRSRWFAGIKSYLLYKLIGKLYTEPSIASATQLFNIHKMDWDDEILDLVGIERKQLPEIVFGDKIIDKLNRDSAEKLGLKPGVRVLPGFYDGGSMIIGMGGYNSKLGVCNLGTTAMFRGLSPRPLLDKSGERRLQTYALSPGSWAIGGAINNAGVVLQWYKDNLTDNKGFDEINKEAGLIAPGADGLFCLPFLTGERDPRIGSLASASFFGLKEYHSSDHISRAILEGVGYSLNMIKETLEENGVKLSALMMGGSGSKSGVWPQILADIFNLPVTISLTSDSTLIGAAILAYYAIGEYKNIAEASQVMVKSGRTFTPKKENVVTYQQGFNFFSELVKRNNELYLKHIKFIQ